MRSLLVCKSMSPKGNLIPPKNRSSMQCYVPLRACHFYWTYFKDTTGVMCRIIRSASDNLERKSKFVKECALNVKLIFIVFTINNIFINY